MEKKQFLKTAAIILICVLTDIALHLMTGAYSTMPENPNYSKLAKLLGTEAAATVWALLAFSCAAYVFYRLHDSIPGAGRAKGLRYGAAISLLWMFAMLEGVALFGNPIINEFVVGLSDAIPVFIMAVLLNLTITGKRTGAEAKQRPPGIKIKNVIIFAAVFVVGRYIAYFTGVINSGHITSPIHTFFWTLIMGVWIGAVYTLLGNGGDAPSLKRRAAKFGLLVFGVNWAAFLIFMPLLFSGFLTDALSRVILDVLLVTLGYFLAFCPATGCDKQFCIPKI